MVVLLQLICESIGAHRRIRYLLMSTQEETTESLDDDIIQDDGEGGSIVDILVVDHKIVNTDREHLEFKTEGRHINRR